MEILAMRIRPQARQASGPKRREESIQRRLVAAIFGSILTFVMLVPSAAVAPLSTGPASGLTPEEASVMASIDYSYAWDELTYLSSLGEKQTGSPEEISAQMYIYDELSAMAVDRVTWEDFPTHGWRHYGTTLMIVSPTTEEITAVTYGDSHSIWGYDQGKAYYFGNANEGKTLIAPVVYAGYGTKAEFDAMGDLDGAIALIKRDDDLTYWPNVMLEEAALHGASAGLFFHYYGTNPLPDGIKQDAVGGSIPALSISDTSALHIIDLLGSGEVVLQADGRADIISEKKCNSANIIAYMTGATRPEEYVVFSAHIDTWWTGTSDDCSGIACMLEYARLFSSLREQGKFVNDRTLVFCSFGCEELGGPVSTWYNWLIGSYEFVKRHPEIVDRTVVDLNLDMVSIKKTSNRYWVELNHDVNDFLIEAINDLGLTGAVTYYNPSYSWVDAWSFHAKGGTSAINLNWVASQDEIYHTQLDNMDLASPEAMKIAIDLYVLLGIRADHCLILPANMLTTIDWVASYLAEGAAEAPSEKAWFAAASAALEDLRTQVEATNAYATDLKAQYDSATTQAEKDSIRADADELNIAIYEARKIVNVWTMGEGGVMGSWDCFVRPHQHSHDLKYVCDAISALNKGRTTFALSALESVYTMEWGKLFSRETYLTVMDWMINDEMYWGAVWDQQQYYVDVQWIHIGLSEKTLTRADALAALKDIKNSQLIPWLDEDLASLESAYAEAAGILDMVI